MRPRATASRRCASATCRAISRRKASRSTCRASVRSRVDVAYGGNYYAIIEPQGAYTRASTTWAQRASSNCSRSCASSCATSIEPVHPVEPTIRGVSHVLWADAPKGEGADGRNAVFYGDKAIDRSPCGTGTSARLAHLHAKGRLKVGDAFVHESYIRSRFIGRVEAETTVGGTRRSSPRLKVQRSLPASIPSGSIAAIPSGRVSKLFSVIHIVIMVIASYGLVWAFGPVIRLDDLHGRIPI